MIEKSERNHQNPAVGPARASLLGLLEEHLAGALGDLAVLLVEHAERVLERLDLRLPAGDALLVAHARVDARRAELLEGLERAVEEFLRVLQRVEIGHEVTAGAVQVRLGLLLAGLLRRDGGLRLLREGREGAGRLVLLGLPGRPPRPSARRRGTPARTPLLRSHRPRSGSWPSPDCAASSPRAALR